MKKKNQKTLIDILAVIVGIMGIYLFIEGIYLWSISGEFLSFFIIFSGIFLMMACGFRIFKRER